MASEPGIIAAYFERSLERKKKAKENVGGVQQQRETRSPQGRKQSDRSAGAYRRECLEQFTRLMQIKTPLQ